MPAIVIVNNDPSRSILAVIAAPPASADPAAVGVPCAPTGSCSVQRAPGLYQVAVIWDDNTTSPSQPVMVRPVGATVTF